MGTNRERYTDLLDATESVVAPAASPRRDYWRQYRGGIRMSLTIQPVAIKEAQRFVELHHRHHDKPKFALFAIGVSDGNRVVGVVIVGRPVARMLCDGLTAEVTRLCVLDLQPNACSMLYAAAWRAAKALGYRRLITYILGSEPGTSLKAAGWKSLGMRGGGSWSRDSRKRIDTHPLEQKQLWEAA